MSLYLPSPSGRSGASLSQHQQLPTKKRKRVSYSSRLLESKVQVATSPNEHPKKGVELQRVDRGAVEGLTVSKALESHPPGALGGLEHNGPTWAVAPPMSPPRIGERQWSSAPQGRLTLPARTGSAYQQITGMADIGCLSNPFNATRSTTKARRTSKAVRATDKSPTIKKARRKQTEYKETTKPYLEEPEEGEWDEGRISFIPSQSRKESEATGLVTQSTDQREDQAPQLGDKLVAGPRGVDVIPRLAEISSKPCLLDHLEPGVPDNMTQIIKTAASVNSVEGDVPLQNQDQRHEPLFLSCGDPTESEAPNTEDSDEDRDDTGCDAPRLGPSIPRPTTRRELLRSRPLVHVGRKRPQGTIDVYRVQLWDEKEESRRVPDPQNETVQTGAQPDNCLPGAIQSASLSLDNQEPSLGHILPVSANRRSVYHKHHTYSKSRRHSYTHGTREKRDPAHTLDFHLLSSSPRSEYERATFDGLQTEIPLADPDPPDPPTQVVTTKRTVARGRGALRNGDWPEKRIQGLFSSTPVEPPRREHISVLRPLTTIFDFRQVPGRASEPVLREPLALPRSSRRSYKSKGRFAERQRDVDDRGGDLLQAPWSPQLHLRSNIDAGEDIMDKEDIYMLGLSRRFRPAPISTTEEHHTQCVSSKTARNDTRSMLVTAFKCRPLHTIKYAEYKQQLMAKTPEERKSDFQVNPRLVRVAKRSLRDASLRPAVPCKNTNRAIRARHIRPLRTTPESPKGDSILRFTPSDAQYRPIRLNNSQQSAKLGQLVLTSRSPPLGDRRPREMSFADHDSRQTLSVIPGSVVSFGNDVPPNDAAAPPLLANAEPIIHQGGSAEVAGQVSGPCDQQSSRWTAEEQELEELGRYISMEDLQRLAEDLGVDPTKDATTAPPRTEALVRTEISSDPKLGNGASNRHHTREHHGEHLAVIPTLETLTITNEHVTSTLMSGVEMTAYLQGFLEEISVRDRQGSTKAVGHSRLEERRMRVQEKRHIAGTLQDAATTVRRRGQRRLKEIRTRNAVKSQTVLSQPFKAPSRITVPPSHIHAEMEAIFKAGVPRFATQPAPGAAEAKLSEPRSTQVHSGPRGVDREGLQGTLRQGSYRSMVVNARATWASQRVFEQYKPPFRPTQLGDGACTRTTSTIVGHSSAREVAEGILREADREAEERIGRLHLSWPSR